MTLLVIFFVKCLYPEAATGGVLSKKMFLEISQNSQENTCARVYFLIKLQSPAPATLLQRGSNVDASVNFAKLLRTPFSTEHLFLQNTFNGCFSKFYVFFVITLNFCKKGILNICKIIFEQFP